MYLCAVCSRNTFHLKINNPLYVKLTASTNYLFFSFYWLSITDQSKHLMWSLVYQLTNSNWSIAGNSGNYLLGWMTDKIDAAL